ncbi:AAA family ATPase [Bacillus idriensis]|uniref:AAA family ATPase n=1 Tax=Metabacillus idriensis TaxID=324768 RepID=A0A6I2MGK1_9BACI|nr:ATP-binding protein [Metabacillus idriensis]MRX56494.1 AAA family ATPase [Metabacillus idriensis]
MNKGTGEKMPYPAVYKKQVVFDFQDNPLIEALPEILSQEEAFNSMTYYPNFIENERELPDHIRFHSISRLNRFFQPVTQHLDLEQRFSRLLRFGYVSRNPEKPEFKKGLSFAYEKLNGNKILCNHHTTASSFTLMGFSGIGKTTAIERVLSLYPQSILHKSPYNLTQIVWMKLNCPHDGSIKTLCINFFLEMDRLLGTKYYERYGQKRNSISSMVIQMGQIARVHCLGALIIDEIQHLLATRDNNSEKMMNFFVTLVNEIGVPVLMIGTMRAKSILQRDFRQARRGSGQGDMVWQQMELNDDWDVLIESMWDYQWTKHKAQLSDELRETIFFESQGIVDIAIKLFALSQGRAISEGSEKISKQLIQKVAEHDLKLVQPMLKALKNGRMSELERYEDIMPISMEEYMQKSQSTIDLRGTIQKKKELQAAKKNEMTNSKLTKLMLVLIEVDIESVLAERIAKKIINDYPDEDQTFLTEAALKLYREEKGKPKRIEQIRKPIILKEIISKGFKRKQSAYESLLQENYILSPVKEFNI